MSITSLQFVIFAAIILLLHYLLPRRFQNGLLLLASYVFLASWAPVFVFWVGLLTLANYYIALELVPGKRRQGRWLLWASVLFNIGVLVYFKYADFFIPYVGYYLERAGLKINRESFILLMPVGLSFYIVQVISYLVDVRKGLLKPVTNLANFALYMAYFPRLLAGPIERARDFMGQLESPRSIDHHQIANSLMLMMVGLVRKIALADSMFLFLPEDIFSDPGKYTSPQLVLWLLVYAFALYNDFAGYTSIARGVSGLFGLRLSRNFSTPYFSESFTQFWLRWHATLSSWMRNYIFMPITRKLLRRKGHSSTVILSILPTVTTMIFTAIWHELSWNMLVWGGLHAVYLLLERLISGVTKSSKGIRAGFKKAGTILIVFILTALAWVPFRMSMPIALKYWGGLFKLSEWRLQMPSLILQPVHLIPLGLVCITLFADYLQNRGGEMVFREIKPLYKALLLNGAVILLLLAYFSQAEVPPPFIYQGF